VARTIRDTHPGRPILLVTGVSADKQVEAVLAEIVPEAAAVVCTRAYHKGAAVSAIAACCEAIRPGIVWRCAPTIEEAMRASLERARAENMVILVAGGLFLAIEASTYLRGGDPRQLRFF
jgi:dihydrofolate synthase/folylpolyglutamate synthase